MAPALKELEESQLALGREREPLVYADMTEAFSVGLGEFHAVDPNGDVRKCDHCGFFMAPSMGTSTVCPVRICRGFGILLK